MEQETREVEASVAQAEQAEQALNNILQATQRVNQQVEEIAGAAAEMREASSELVQTMAVVKAVVETSTTATEKLAVGSREVNQSVEEIASVSEENSAAVEQVSASAEEMSAQMEEVATSAQRLWEMADALQALILHFKLNQSALETNEPNTDKSLFISWGESMSSGIPQVDEQHQALIGQLNTLVKAMSQGQGPDKIEPLLDFLTEYTLNHFSFEEECMTKYHCPTATKNKEAYQHFVEIFLDLRERIKRDGPSPMAAVEVRQVLSNWLVNHIGRVDKQLKPCVKSSIRGRDKPEEGAKTIRV